MKRTLVAFLVLGAVVSFGRAQTAAPFVYAGTTTSPQGSSTVKNPVTTVLRTILPTRQKNIVAAVDAMPADKFSYKPTPDQITFAHLVVHIAQSNNSMCAKIADIPEPKVEELKETDPKDKLVAAVRASFDFCNGALANVDDSKLGDVLDFGRTQGPRAMAVFFLAGGWADHYGAAAMYLRLNGILPPTAQPKK
jgi:DinB superfamily